MPTQILQETPRIRRRRRITAVAAGALAGRGLEMYGVGAAAATAYDALPSCAAAIPLTTMTRPIEPSHSVGPPLTGAFPVSPSVVPFPVQGDAAIEPLSSDELAELSSQYARTRDKSLRDELILHHQRLVRSLASKFLGAGESLDDLIQVGNIGLINALDRYDPNQGTRFSTYATPTIIGEIKRYFRDKTAGIKVPRWLQELNLATRRTAQALTNEMGRVPTVAEIADRLGTTEEQVLEALESHDAVNLLSLDTHLDGHSNLDSSSLLDLIGSVDTNLYEFENFTDLRTAIAALDKREQEVISLRFFDELSQAKIAQRMNVSQMHVSRLQQRALNRLRILLSEESRLRRFQKEQ